ncbi:MAG: endonuclease/exonuclease/phosphatase family protein [Thiohalocapsa sp.]|nr:endonuclease/exonuclease/phosphatase family protein [Thiohalocapsa sp.]
MNDGERRIVAATYNIHRCVGADRRGDVERIAGVILALDADVLALQEVETAHAPSSQCLLRSLRQHGYVSIAGPTLTNERHHYGNVLLCRLRVLAIERLDISRPGREPRGLVAARLAVPAPTPAGAPDDVPTLYCVATHLGLRAAERRAQIAQIAARIDRASTRPNCAGILLLGDFNEWLPWQRRLKPFDERLRRAPARATFPSLRPLLALDRLWYSAGLGLERIEAVGTAAARRASDHLPLRASLWLPDSAVGAPAGRATGTARALREHAGGARGL